MSDARHPERGAPPSRSDSDAREGSAIPLWAPTPEQIARANLTRFIEQVRAIGDYTSSVVDFPSLYAWSIRDLELFWMEVWRFCGIVAGANDPSFACDRPLIGRTRVAPPDPELGPKWFVGARLNFAENLLRYRDDRDALVFWTEQRARSDAATYRGPRATRSRASPRHCARTASASAIEWPASCPTCRRAVIAMLAATSIGAIWSSCSPDFGVNGVLDRFGQIEPRVLFCADGYRYGGREIDCLERAREIAERIPSIERVVVASVSRRRAGRLSDSRRRAVGAISHLATRRRLRLEFEQLPFDHPLYIMYSSGTTGLPKCMVHGAGGTLSSI